LLLDEYEEISLGMNNPYDGSSQEPSGWFSHKSDKEHKMDHWRRVAVDHLRISILVGIVENLGLLVESLGNVAVTWHLVGYHRSHGVAFE
jgi:hypothetical protein